jgi:hypothetical protein
MNPLPQKADETNGWIEFLQPYPVVVADTLLEIGMAVISVFLSLDQHLSQTDHFLCSEMLLQVCVLLLYSLLPCQIATHR